MASHNDGGNVTPFRRSPQREPDRRSGSMKDPHAQAVLVHGLAIGCFAVFFFSSGQLFDFLALACGFGALIIAASKRSDPPSWAATHHEFTLRTMLIAGSIWLVAAALTIVPLLGGLLAFPVKVALLAWVGVRSGYAILRARDRAPIPRPRSLFL